MSADAIFKKATFGGFDRDDVMAYIDAMKKREAELTKELESAKEHNEEMKKKLDDAVTLSKSLKNACNSLKSEYDEKIANLTSAPQPELEALSKKYEEAEAMHGEEIEKIKSEYEKQLGDLRKKIDDIKSEEKHGEDIKKIKSDYEKQLSDLNKKLTELKKDNKNLKNSHTAEIESIKNQYEEKIRSLKGKASDNGRVAEEKVGTIMLDIRRYADMLVKEACEKIDKSSDDVDKAVALTLSRVVDLSSTIQNFSDKMNLTLSGLLKDSENICKDLTEFKGTLKVPFDEAADKMHNEIFKD